MRDDELTKFLTLTRYYAIRARRERFMRGDADLALHWFMKASAAMVCLQAQIEIDAREIRR